METHEEFIASIQPLLNAPPWNIISETVTRENGRTCITVERQDTEGKIHKTITRCKGDATIKNNLK